MVMHKYAHQNTYMRVFIIQNSFKWLIIQMCANMRIHCTILIHKSILNCILSSMKMRKGLPFTTNWKHLIDIVLNEDSVAESLLAYVRPYI